MQCTRFPETPGGDESAPPSALKGPLWSYSRRITLRWLPIPYGIGGCFHRPDLGRNFAGRA